MRRSLASIRWARGFGASAWLLVLGMSPAYAQTVYSAHLGAGAGWTDNILLAPPGETTDAEIYQLLPGIYVKHDSQNLHLTLDYELQGYQYAGGQHGHDVYQNGSFYGDGAILPGWLYLGAGANASQSVVNPTAPANPGLLFPTGNLADQTGGSAAPALRHTFSWVALDASYTWGFVKYKPVGAVEEPLFNSTNETGLFKLSSPDPKSTITWDAFYQRQETQFTQVVAPQWLDETVQADVGWLVAPPLRILAEGGTETNLTQGVANGGLDAPFWLGGFDWSPDQFTEVRLMAGHRFFGPTYQASLRHTGRLLTLQVSYSETPTTTANGTLPQPPTQNLVTIPGSPTFQRVTPDSYVAKALDARAALTGRLTELGLDLTSTEQNYFTLNGVPTTTPIADRMRSATVYASRRMGAQLSGSLSATWDHADLRESLSETYNDRTYVLSLNDQVGVRTTVILAATHTERYGAQRYTVNLVMLTANMTFGNAPMGGVPNGTIAPGAAAPGQIAPGPINPAPGPRL